jgi:hypothetical protein
MLRSPFLAFSGPCDVYILGQRVSIKYASEVVMLPCSWQTHCFSQTLRLVGFAPFNVGCSGRVLAAASVNQSSITVSTEFLSCLKNWFSMCAQFSNKTSFCVAPVMMSVLSSRWFQEIVAINGSQVILKAPGLKVAVFADAYMSSALPSTSQVKSFGMFDSVAAPAVYPIFAVKKVSQQTPYSPHDTSVVFDSNHNPITLDPGPSAPVPLSNIHFETVLSVSRNTIDRNFSAACPSVVTATPTPIASTFVGVMPERAPSVRRCLLHALEDGSTASNWVSEVQLSNHLSMPFMVSAIV